MGNTSTRVETPVANSNENVSASSTEASSRASTKTSSIRKKLPTLLGRLKSEESANKSPYGKDQQVQIWLQKTGAWAEAKVTKVYPNGDLACSVLNQPMMSTKVVPAGLVDQLV